MNKLNCSTNYPINYHAHVYFDNESVQFATALCQQVKRLFNFNVGRIHCKPVGPHPMWSCQISFSQQQFDDFIPWLDQHRGELTVFVHALTGDDLKDHTEYAYWLGESVKLKLSIFT